MMTVPEIKAQCISFFENTGEEMFGIVNINEFIADGLVITLNKEGYYAVKTPYIKSETLGQTEDWCVIVKNVIKLN